MTNAPWVCGQRGNYSLPFDIAVVGLGIVGVYQITREVEEVVRRCRHIFVVDSGHGVLDYLRTHCAEVTDLTPLYVRGKNRLPTYHRMAAEVISAAIGASPVCFATYGHPRVFCYPTTLIKRAAEVLELRVEIFPGISSLDTMLVDLDVDIASDGVQMYEATDVLVRRRPLQNDVGCILWQATTLCDPTYPDRPVSVEQIAPLQNYLLRFYPSHHPVVMVMSKTFPLLRSTIQRFPLERLAIELAQGPLVGTLYLPPVCSRQIEDYELLNRMYHPQNARTERPAVVACPDAASND